MGGGRGAKASLTDTNEMWLNPCERAGIAAERAAGLPTGLLLAIGRVESGRWDATRGRMTSWPWAINAAGKGQWFDSKTAAIQTVRTLFDNGVRSIDVGCFQISLMYHPAAFANLDEAFDPDTNARYAARFLLSLYIRTGSWETAVEDYHSAVPMLGFAYRQQVYSTWLATAPVAATAGPLLRTDPAAGAPRQRSTAMPVVMAGVQVWMPMPAGSAATVVAMPGSVPAQTTAAVAGSAAALLPGVTYHALPAGLTPRR